VKNPVVSSIAQNIQGETPRNVVVILLDSLNRHMLKAYGGTEFETPNIDRFAERAVRFDQHYTGSLPCMPARHDILCGALDFLWRPWGSIEIWEDPITRYLETSGVTTMLVSDHPHLFETGGENYHTEFTAWEYVRGHEDDPWRTAPDLSWVGQPAVPATEAWIPRAYDISRTWFKDAEDFPGARTMTEAARWLRTQAPAADRFMLFIDEFDPHEPFDAPEPWMSMYDPDWVGDKMIWPPYSAETVASGLIDERTARHVRANYGAKLSFIDHCLGRVFDALDEGGFWEDTAVILCTDHGHYLGEKDIFGKPGVPVFQPLGHIPLMISWPGRSAGSVDALTTTVDIFATLCEIFDVQPEHRTHGHSLLPLITGESHRIRDSVLTGVWGRGVQLITDSHKFVRSPRNNNRPISLWSNRWSTMPVRAMPGLRLPRPDNRAVLETMPGSTVPVLRQPFGPDDQLPFWARTHAIGSIDMTFDLREDPNEDRNLAGGDLDAELTEQLRSALQDLEAPAEQFIRLGL
jgi:arylsulfatase A-like enzyme